MIRRTEEQKREILARIDSDKAQGVQFDAALKSAGIQKSNYYAWRADLKKATPVTSPKYTTSTRRTVRKKPEVLTRTRTETSQSLTLSAHEVGVLVSVLKQLL